jgi:FkbM family methyltransferase
MNPRPVPVFDSERPWGAYRPQGWDRLAIELAHRLSPRVRLLHRIAVLLRRRTKYGASTPLDVEVWGLRMRLLPRGNLSESEMLFAPQFLDRRERGWLAEKLRPGGVFVDVGANAGAYSFHVISRFGSTVRTLAIEPDPEMRRRIAFNAATNGIETLEIRPVALSDRRGRAVLATKESQRGQNQLHESREAVPENRVGVEVEVDTLVHVLQSSGVTRVDALKMDIEGHEPRVLGHFFANAPEALFPRALLTERKEQTADGIAETLARNGYRRVGQTRRNWMFERGTAGAVPG